MGGFSTHLNDLGHHCPDHGGIAVNSTLYQADDNGLAEVANEAESQRTQDLR